MRGEDRNIDVACADSLLLFWVSISILHNGPREIGFSGVLLPVSGCFLMATGETPPSLGFAAPFGRHAEMLQERLAWHPRPRRTDRFCRYASRALLAMSFALALTFLGMAGRAAVQTATHAPVEFSVEGNVHVSVD